MQVRQRKWLKAVLTSIALILLASCSFSPAQPTPAATEAGAMAEEPSSESLSSTATDTQTRAEPAAIAAADTNAAQENPVSAPLAATLYNGEIVASDEVNVVAEVGGQVLQVLVEVGDRVAAGDPLVQIDRVRLEAQRAQALAALEAAQAQLDLITTPPDEADLAAAQAGVAAASAAYREATKGASAEDLRLAEAQLRSAQAGVTAAQAAYNRVKGDVNIASRPETLQLQQAKLGVQAAQAQYDKVKIGATQDVIAGAYARLAQAQAGLKNLQEGATTEQVEAVAAGVQQAETALFLAQLQLNKATVRAPIDGIVARITTAPGSLASTGAPLIVLLSTQLEVVIPVEELRLPQLRVGQPAVIQVAAYPNQVYAGEVALIAPKLDPATRTVRVTVRPTGDAADLAPGMFATVELPFE